MPAPLQLLSQGTWPIYMVRLGMWGQGIKFTTFKELSFRMEACKY